MKAAPTDQARLLDLQKADLAIARLIAQRAKMPEVARVAHLTAEHAAARDAAVLRRTEAADLQRQLRKAEDDVERVRARAARDADLLSSGSVTSAKQLQDLEHEVASLAKRQADLEDAELDLMEAAEVSVKAQQAAEIRRDELAAEMESAITERDNAIAELTAQYRATQAHRHRMAAAVPPDLLALYDKIRTDRDGVGAAALDHGRCGGCQLQMVATDLAAITASAPDDVVRCEECQRIIVRTSPA